MKKVLLLAPMSSVHERFNIANIDALRVLRTEIHLAANFNLSDNDRAYREKCENEGIHTHQIDFKRSSLFKNLKTIPELIRLIKKEEFDIVHAHTETGGILTFIVSFFASSDYLYTPHGMSFYKGSSLKSQLIYSPIEWAICKRMKRVLAMNGEEYETLKKWNKNTAAHIHGVGLDIEKIKEISVNKKEKRAEFGICEDKTLILSVGELNENKNHRVVIEALGRLQNSNVHYMICGEGEKREALKRQAEERGVPLTLTGYRYDAKEIMKAADIFVFPSYHEGLPVSVMEAMTVGLPIICSDIRGNVDLIDNGKSGILCNPDSTEDFKEALISLMEGIELREAYGRAAAEYVESFSLSAVTKELTEIYKQSIQTRTCLKRRNFGAL